MADERCIHEMLPGQCGVCRPPVEPGRTPRGPNRPLPSDDRGFIARYDGRCEYGDEILAGERIEGTIGEGYHHPRCADDHW